MMGGAKYERILLLLLLLSPSILFGAYYLSTSLPPAGGARHIGMTTADQGWSVNLTVRYSPYFITGQQVPIDLTLKLQVTNPNVTIGVGYIGVEFREPLKINSTSGVVSEWSVLSSALRPVRQNYASPGLISRTISLVATYPPTRSLLDLFAPSDKVAINGIANFTVYQTSGNATTTTLLTISELDSQTFYQTQLSTIISASSWLVYQLLTALLVSAVYIQTRPASTSSVDRTYVSRLETYKLERSLAHLDELLKAGKVSESSYSELKQDYEKELTRVKAADRG
jgi:hypothetical protein